MVTLTMAASGFRLAESPLALLRHIAAWVPFAFGGTPAINGVAYTNIYLVVVWTLRFEWVFYAILPLLGYFARSSRRTYLFIVLCYAARYGCLALYGSRHRVPGVGVVSWFLGWMAYGFCIGIFAAVLNTKFQPRKAASSSIASVVSLASLALLTPLVGSKGSCFLEALLLLIPFLSVLWGNTFWGFLVARPTILLGQISYSIYLLHTLVLGITMLGARRYFPQLMGNAAFFWMVIAGAGFFLLALSTLSHRLFEVPFIPAYEKAKKSQDKPVEVLQAALPQVTNS